MSVKSLLNSVNVTPGGSITLIPSNSAFSPTSSAPNTQAELEINISSSFPSNIISDTKQNPFIRFTVISGSNLGGTNSDIVIRFFSQSHIQTKYRSGLNTNNIVYVKPESASIYLQRTSGDNIEFLDVEYTKGQTGPSLGVSTFNAITSSNAYKQGLISASFISSALSHSTTIQYVNARGAIQTAPILSTGSGDLPLGNSIVVAYTTTGSGNGFNFSETALISPESASFIIGPANEVTDTSNIVFRQGISSSGFLNNNNTDATLFFFSSSGDVGIGTQTPSTKLDVSGSVIVKKIKTISTGSTGRSIILEGDRVKFFENTEQNPDSEKYDTNKEKARIRAVDGSYNLMMEVSGSTGYTKSFFISQSGEIGFNTDKPTSGFDVLSNESTFQKPGARKGLKINEFGDVESFNRDLASAATGSEILLKYSRGVAINSTFISEVFGESVADDGAAETFFNSLTNEQQNEGLKKAEVLGLIVPPSVGDILGSIRFVAESGSIGDLDERSSGETAAIKAIVSEGATDGVSSDLIFSVANKSGAAQQRLRLKSGGVHQLTGSLLLTSNLTVGGIINNFDNSNTFLEFLNSGNDLRFVNNSKDTLRLKSGEVHINSLNANIDFRVDGDNNDHLIFTDAHVDKVAIGTGTVGNSLLTINGDLTSTHITASGNISASGGVTAHSFTGSFSGAVTGDATGLTGTPSISVTNITASGNISASGTITAEHFFSSDDAEINDNLTVGGKISLAGDGGSTREILIEAHGDRGKLMKEGNASYWQVAQGGNQFEITDAANGNSTKGNVMLRVSGNDPDDNELHLATNNGKVGINTSSPSSSLSVEGNINTVGTGGHITASGNISASGTIIANKFEVDNNTGLVGKNVAGADRTLITLDNSNILKIKGNDSEGSSNVITMVAGGDVTMPADLTVAGILTAQEFHTEFVSASILFESGSTKFGDTQDDIHQITGSLLITGSKINLNGTNAELNVGTSQKAYVGVGTQADYSSNYTDQAAIVINTVALEGTGGSGLKIRNHVDSAFGSITTDKYIVVNGGSILTSNSKTFLTLTEGTGNAFAIGAIGTSTDENNTLKVFSTSNNSPLLVGSGSSNYMIVSSSGEVGIGTTTPSEKLEVAGKAIIRRTGTATAHSDTDLLVTDSTAGSSTAAIQILGGATGHSNLQFSDTDSYNQGGILYSHSTDTMTIKAGASTAITITGSNQSVGIGTTTPGELLHVAGNITLGNNKKITFRDGAGNDGTSITYDSNALFKITQANSGELRLNAGFNDNSNNKITFLTQGSSERMRITNDGNVGIGLTEPARKFHIHESSGTAYLQLTHASNGSGSSDGFQISMGASQVNLINRENGNMVFETNNTEGMRLNNSQNLGIGNNNPPEKLTVTGNISSSGAIHTLSHITASGNISASGRVYGTHFGTGNANRNALDLATDNTMQFRINDGSRITFTQTQFRPTTDEAVALGRSANKFSELVVKHVTASGNISASGTIGLSGSLNFNAANNEIRTFQAGASSGNISINPDGQLNLGSDRTDNVLIGRQNNTGYTTRIFDGTSTIAIKVGNPYVELNVPVTASGNISASGTIIGNLVPQIPKVEMLSVTSSTLTENTVMGLPNSLTYITSSGGYEYLEIFTDGIRLNRNIDYAEVDTSSVRFLVSIPSQSIITYKSLRTV